MKVKTKSRVNELLSLTQVPKLQTIARENQEELMSK